jgi:hypothetical protein
MVLSDNPATREIFGRAAVLTNGEAADIAKAVQRAVAQRDRLGAEARRLREDYDAPWQAKAAIAHETIVARAIAARRGLV